MLFLIAMVEDKYSKDLRTSQKTKEDFSYFDAIKDEELKTKVLKYVEDKSKEPIELGDYYWVPSFFKDKETGKEVQMVYRFFDKEKAVAKAAGGGFGGNKQFAPKKPSIITFRDPNRIEVADEETRKTFEKQGYHILPYSLTGKPSIFENKDGIEMVWLGQIYNVEL